MEVCCHSFDVLADAIIYSFIEKYFYLHAVPLKPFTKLRNYLYKQQVSKLDIKLEDLFFIMHM